MEFGILGPLEVREGERPLRLGGAKQRALLAILLLHANQVVSRDRLIDDLWGEEPPGTAKTALHGYISQLRKVLRHGDGKSGNELLLTRSNGYVLAVEPGQLDADRFVRLRAEARDAFDWGDAATASQTLREALVLWRGDPLADFRYESFAQAEIARLEELRLVALEERIDADLALGRDAELVPELETLIAAHPLRERPVSQLMLALYRSGRQSEALEVYQKARRQLADDLGIDPGPALKELERAILAQDGSVAPLSRRRRLPSPTNLPAQPSPLVGREREVGEAQTLVRAHRLVTLTGAGGTGKTSLALRAAAELADEFEDGVFWAPLAPVTDPELVLPAAAEALGGKGELAEQIGERRILLLLDNLEQVLGVAPHLSRLLGACPNLHVLVTSRALLRIEGEREYVVEPLLLPDAVALFRARAAVAEPEDAVAEVCRRVDCLPLAVELAAARTAILPPAALSARLERRLPVLTAGRRDAPERQRTLRATIAWSYELLSPEERELFRRLGAFAGSFDAAAAEAVADAQLGTLQSLVEISLVRRWGSGRLAMLETIREFALERLEESGEAEEIRRLHLEFLFGLAESANLAHEAEGPERYDLLEHEGENVRAALEWALATGELELGVRLAVSLEHFWVARNPFEGMRWFGVLLARDGRLAPELRARALRAWGGCTFIVGCFEDGTRRYEESLALYRALGDERGVGILLQRLSVSELVRGDIARARALAEESGELARRAGFRKGEALAIGTLGEIDFADGDDERGFRLMEESAALAEEVGFSWWASVTLSSLAEKAVALGRWTDAERWARQALPQAHAIGERQFLVFGLAELARVAAHSGRAERAGTLWGAVEAEEARGAVGQWEGEREHYAVAVLAAAGSDFERGRGTGRTLTLGEAVEYALADA